MQTLNIKQSLVLAKAEQWDMQMPDERKIHKVKSLLSFFPPANSEPLPARSLCADDL